MLATDYDGKVFQSFLVSSQSDEIHFHEVLRHLSNFNVLAFVNERRPKKKFPISTKNNLYTKNCEP